MLQKMLRPSWRTRYGWVKFQRKHARLARKAKKELTICFLALLNLIYLVIGRIELVQAFAREVSVLEKVVVLIIFALSIWLCERAFYLYGRARQTIDETNAASLKPPWHWIVCLVCAAYFFAAVSADSGVIFLIGSVAVFFIWWKGISKWYQRRLDSETNEPKDQNRS